MRTYFNPAVLSGTPLALSQTTRPDDVALTRDEALNLITRVQNARVKFADFERAGVMTDCRVELQDPFARIDVSPTGFDRIIEAEVNALPFGGGDTIYVSGYKYETVMALLDCVAEIEKSQAPSSWPYILGSVAVGSLLAYLIIPGLK